MKNCLAPVLCWVIPPPLPWWKPEAAGSDLNPKSFQMGMESLNYEDVVSGNTVSYPIRITKVDEVVVSVIKDGNWVELVRQ